MPSIRAWEKPRSVDIGRGRAERGGQKCGEAISIMALFFSDELPPHPCYLPLHFRNRSNAVVGKKVLLMYEGGL